MEIEKQGAGLDDLDANMQFSFFKQFMLAF
jgi:hypothetical protein